MVKTIINEEVILSYPDGFEEMDRAQLKESFLDALKSWRQGCSPDDDFSKILNKLTIYPVLKFSLHGRIL